jgi:RNA-binding protein 39
MKPTITQSMQSRSVLLKNMFDPEEYVYSIVSLSARLIYLSRETERDWDKELADDVRGECEEKFGKVAAIKVEKETHVRLCTLREGVCLTFCFTGRDLREI